MSKLETGLMKNKKSGFMKRNGLMKKKRVWLFCVLPVALLAAGCFHTNAGVPNSYADQRVAIEQDRLEPGFTTASRTEKNFLDACLAGDMPDICRCTYNTIVRDIDFDDFEDFNNELERKPEMLRLESGATGISTVLGNILEIRNRCRSSCKGTGGCNYPKLPVLVPEA